MARTGRPLKFQDPAELDSMIGQYFASCRERWEDYEDLVEQRDDKGKPVIIDGKAQYDRVTKSRRVDAQVPTITGLAVYLDTSRETLLEYEERPEFVDAIKRAKDRIHYETERILTSGAGNVTGAIFSLKNNWGWKDKNETDVTSGGEKLSGYALIPPKRETDAENA